MALKYAPKENQMAVIEYEVRDKIAYVTLNRPETLNAINNEMAGAWNGSLGAIPGR